MEVYVRNMKREVLSLRDAAVLGFVVGAIAVIWLWQMTHRIADAVFVICPATAFAALLILGSDRTIVRLRAWVDARPWRIALAPAGLWILYATYAWGMGIADVRSAAIMAAYLAIPFIFLRPRLIWLEPLAILSVWLPLEFGFLRPLLMTPASAVDFHYAFAQLLAINAGIIAFVIWNRTPHVGYRFEWNRNIGRSTLTNFAIFAAMAIPLGLVTRFIHYAFNLSKLWQAPLLFVGIFFFTALPEEFLFRGLIQNWIERVSSRSNLSLFIAALIFGAAHLNNGPSIPNYRYFLMASIAGIFYGRAWRTAGSLMASSFTHAMVDTLWTVFFR